MKGKERIIKFNCNVKYVIDSFSYNFGNVVKLKCLSLIQSSKVLYLDDVSVKQKRHSSGLLNAVSIEQRKY